jgi:hypothetical protein
MICPSASSNITDCVGKAGARIVLQSLPRSLYDWRLDSLNMLDVEASVGPKAKCSIIPDCLPYLLQPCHTSFLGRRVASKITTEAVQRRAGIA